MYGRDRLTKSVPKEELLYGSLNSPTLSPVVRRRLVDYIQENGTEVTIEEVVNMAVLEGLKVLQQKRALRNRTGNALVQFGSNDTFSLSEPHFTGDYGLGYEEPQADQN